jgi:hypothetical protein
MVCQRTVTTAVIDGWIRQWYANVPAVANVRANVAPFPSDSLVKEPSSAVTVWLALSLFVQVTVVPTGTVIVAGTKLKSVMATVLPVAGDTAAGGAAVAAGAADVAGAAVGAGVALPEQAATVSRSGMSSDARRRWRTVCPPGRS